MKDVRHGRAAVLRVYMVPGTAATVTRGRRRGSCKGTGPGRNHGYPVAGIVRRRIPHVRCIESRTIFIN